MKKGLVLLLLLSAMISAQQTPKVDQVELQPLTAQIRRLIEAMDYLGAPIKSWVALRTLPSSHTNPIFVIVGGKPVRASRRSAEWCLKACWSQKAPKISAKERDEAAKACEHARRTYCRILAESKY